MSQVVIKPYRSVAEFVADAVIEEHHSDELVITKHPVEQGAVVGDHAYKLPAVVRITYGWTASSPAAGDDPDYLKKIYEDLLTMQLDRNPFEVWTGKRRYENMLMTSIRVDTDKRTENVLLVYFTCEELLQAKTEIVVVPVAADQADQADPEKTAAVVPQGQKLLSNAPNYNNYPN